MTFKIGFHFYVSFLFLVIYLFISKFNFKVFAAGKHLYLPNQGKCKKLLTMRREYKYLSWVYGEDRNICHEGH